MINDFFLLAVMAGLLFKINAHLAVDALAVLPGILLVTLIFRKYVRDANRRIRTAIDRKSTRLNSSHGYISYAVFCLKKKKHTILYNLNALLCLFNLLPIPPLDGAGIAEGLFPNSLGKLYDQIREVTVLHVVVLVVAL